MRPFLALMICALALVSGRATAAGPVAAPHVTVELAAQTAGAAPGSSLYAAVILTAEKGWHTYWRNPGDAGEATKIAWALPAGWRAGPIVWPAPRRLPVGPIMNYGYEGRAILAAPIEIPASAAPGHSATLGASVDYLVCAEVCVPGSAKVSLTLPVTSGAPPLDPKWGKAITDALMAAPKPAGLEASFHYAGPLTLAVAGPALTGVKPADVYFYPYSDTLIDQAKPQAVERGQRGLTLTLASGTGAHAASVAGVLAVDGKAYEITATPGPPPAGAAGLGRLGQSRDVGLALALVYGFLGGLILNLMPCVFPILSMKAAALARHGGGAAARGEGLAFLAGVLITFAALAGALIAARAAGEAVGWGFQLQSPLNVALLALVMLAAALNLSGLYEIGASAQGLGSGLTTRSEMLASALTGALAVVVAAPCTAPFMGPALGFALTQAPAVALAVFLALGLGFAAPFTAMALSPTLTRRLPRPGPWMDGLKKLLAFPMYGAALWLAWVLSQQTGPLGLARLFAAALALAMAAWLFGVTQRRRAAGEGGRLWPAIAAAASLILALAAVGAGAFEPPVSAASAAAAPAPGKLAASPYSPDRLATLRAARTPVLVNFTAAWCVTCQVNERVAFASPDVAAAFKRAGAVYLVADWTNRDPAIAKALADEGRIGVPLYLFYAPGAQRPQVLPQLLTPAILTDALAVKPA
ncbi:MAG TPA: thioredoxin family protein [Caulobacteraceae bacterium]|jgi:thiol:disulfide interchange protein DsbD